VLVELGDAGLERIGVGGYPEGHPLIGDEVLLDALAQKEKLADLRGERRSASLREP
jgi:methylenetetrahydrofolate reductase (NADPH)